VAPAAPFHFLFASEFLMAVNFVLVAERGESIESLLRRLKKATQKSQTLTESRAHDEFISRPERRRKKSAQAQARQRKASSHHD
jgi:ribosomal protein S21